MSKIDWSKAPEGATHHVAGGEPNWFKETDKMSNYYWWNDGDGWEKSNYRDIAATYGEGYEVTSRPLDSNPRSSYDFVQFVSVDDAQPEGRKLDGGKVIMGAIPPDAELAVARVLTFGAEKYSRDNWRKVPEMDVRYMDAALRHLNAYRRGESVDAESGESHLAHAACCIMFLLQIKEQSK